MSHMSIASEFIVTNNPHDYDVNEMVGSLNRHSITSQERESLKLRPTSKKGKKSKYNKNPYEVNNYEKYLGGDADLQWGERFRQNQDTSVSGSSKQDTFYHRKN